MPWLRRSSAGLLAAISAPPLTARPALPPFCFELENTNKSVGVSEIGGRNRICRGLSAPAYPINRCCDRLKNDQSKQG
ncbi:hypothetical protein PR001_g5584 [Phytophthora rubi]|uniref:Uncharacterized protein n=1 Tax=Phytophthora rubi TaxID=129364 RepID=A0A6A3NTU7_9STRA|nr:hypothetical protein PR001_g5584 [Phytophthora rubi]